MSLPIPRSKAYRERAGPGETPCVICGRGVRSPWEHAVHVGGSGLLLVTEAEAAEDPNGDLGACPVGRGCWRRHPEIHAYGA